MVYYDSAATFRGMDMASTCTATIPADLGPSIFMLGTRDVAAPLRDKVERALDTSEGSVCVDFRELLVSHSFMDEFLGVMILRRGPVVLDRVIFRNCNDDVKAVVQLVASIRTQDYGASTALVK
jgi:hypothetical protein